MRTKTAICTVVNKIYISGLEVMLKTLITTNPDLLSSNTPLIILKDPTVSDQDLLYCKTIYPNTQIIHIDYTPYKEICNKFYRHDFEKDTNMVSYCLCGFLKYEIFSINKVDRLVYIDSDCMITGDISYLLNYDKPFGAVREINNGTTFDEFNTGVMVLNKQYLNRPDITQDLITYTTLLPIVRKLDQIPMNDYFQKEISEIPIEYNFLKLYCSEQTQTRTYHLSSQCKILHYVLDKPWYGFKYPTQLKFPYLYTHEWWVQEYLKVYKHKKTLNIPCTLEIQGKPVLS
jgi:lipopolysaccharide biosynthesis glycosyltransferase